MAFKLLSEATAAWAAVVLTAGGGVFTIALRSGQSNAQIMAISQRQVETDAHVARHDDQLTKIQEQSSRIEQKLSDVADDVHDIKTQVHSRDRHR